jgi:DNA-binding response OmpR family regulator
VGNSSETCKDLNRILYLEDDVDFHEVVQMSLEDIGGFKVKVCSNVEDFLIQAEKFQPDLFLLDIMLPDTSGPLVLMELRKNPKFNDIPAIFISASLLGYDIIKYRELGVLGVIRKPFDPINISQTIEVLFQGEQPKSCTIKGL